MTDANVAKTKTVIPGNGLPRRLELLDLSHSSSVRRLGEFAACPVIEKVAAKNLLNSLGGSLYSNESIEHLDEYIGGLNEKQSVRYWRIGFLYGEINRRIEADENHDLLENMGKKLERPRILAIEKYEAGTVPPDYAEYMYPMNNLAQFAIPRMLIDFLDEIKTTDQDKPASEAENKAKNADRYLRAFEIIDAAISDTKDDPLELMARITEGFRDKGANVEKILKLVLGQAWVDEQDATEVSDDAKEKLKTFAPGVWDAYKNLKTDERKRLNLVEPTKDDTPIKDS